MIAFFTIAAMLSLWILSTNVLVVRGRMWWVYLIVLHVIRSCVLIISRYLPAHPQCIFWPKLPELLAQNHNLLSSTGYAWKFINNTLCGMIFIMYKWWPNVMILKYWVFVLMYYRCDYHKIIYSVRLLVWKLVRVVINFLDHPDILILFSDYGWMIMRLRMCKNLSYKSFDINSTNQSMSNYKLMVTTGSWCVFYISCFSVKYHYM